MDKTLQKKAAVIASAAKDAGGMFVFATTETNLLNDANASAVIAKFKYLEHSCTDCGTVFAAPEIAGMEYHCSACGSGRVEASVKVVKPVIANDEALSLVNCTACHTHNVLPRGVVAATSHLNCTACGHSMHYKNTATTKVKADLGDDLDLDGLDGLDDGLDGELLDLDDIDSMDTVDIEDDSLFDDVTAADDGQDIPSKEDGENTNEIPSDQPLDMDPAVTPAVTKGDDQGIDPPESPPVTVDLLSEFDSNKDSHLSPEGTQLSFVYVGKSMSIAAATDDQVVILATLSPEAAGEHAEIMQTQAFQTAVAHSVKTLGLSKTVANYNFKPSTLTVNVKAEALKRVEATVATDKKKITAKIAEIAADFQQSLDIAAAGFAANFWRNKQDPVKAALITEFTSIGVKNAAKVVDRIFASHGVAQVREILTIARELSEQDVAARNGLAQAMNLSKYLPTQATVEDESDLERLDTDDVEDTEEATVATVATPVSSVTARKSETASPYKTSELQSILGGKSLFN